MKREIPLSVNRGQLLAFLRTLESNDPRALYYNGHPWEPTAGRARGRGTAWQGDSWEGLLGSQPGRGAWGRAGQWCCTERSGLRGFQAACSRGLYKIHGQGPNPDQGRGVVGGAPVSVIFRAP